MVGVRLSLPATIAPLDQEFPGDKGARPSVCPQSHTEEVQGALWML